MAWRTAFGEAIVSNKRRRNGGVMSAAAETRRQISASGLSKTTRQKNASIRRHIGAGSNSSMAWRRHHGSNGKSSQWRQLNGNRR